MEQFLKACFHGIYTVFSPTLKQYIFKKTKREKEISSDGAGKPGKEERNKWTAGRKRGFMPEIPCRALGRGVQAG
jgi:hypothetical protein